MTESRLKDWSRRSPVQYGLAVLYVAAALAISELLSGSIDAKVLFFAAVMLSAWFGGRGPGLLAVLFATLAIDYFFEPPVYQFTLGINSMLRGGVFVMSALLISWLSGRRKRAEAALRQARDDMEAKVQDRTAALREINEQLQTEITERKRIEETLQERASLLDLTHDTVFVRDMNDVITYWNRGAENLYGWRKDEAIGQVSHRLTQTDFPAPLEAINRELLDTGRWEGELIHAKRDGSKVVVASRWSLQRDAQGKPAAILETNNDITEGRRAEDALRGSEEQWRAVFENNPTMYFMVDADGTILSVNPFGAEQLGYTVDELVGSPVLNVFLEADRDAVQRNVTRCFDRLNRSMSWEARKVRKDGKVLSVRETGRAVLLKNHPVILVACEDVTERKLTEEQLKMTEQRLRTVIANAPVILFALDRSGAFTLSEGRGLDALGLKPGEVVGKSVFDIYRAAPQVLSSIRRALTGESLTEVAEVEDLVFETHYIPVFDEDGQVSGVNGVALNITERRRAEKAVRRSERELRDVIETIPTSAWTALPDGSVDFVNGYWREYTGLSSESTSGLGWLAAVHKGDLDKYAEKRRASMASGEPFEGEVRLRRAADGEYRWFLSRAVPLRDDEGKILKWYGTLTDIEDRKHAEALLAGEKRILEMVARGASLVEILDSLCRFVEEQAPDALASILLVEGKRLRHGGAPSLPKAYTDAMDGILIGPGAGSCGTAAFSGKQVIVSDIATDPSWADYREPALAHSLRASWSTPVFSSDGKVIATFAIYYREPRGPSAREQEIIQQITHLAGVAIQRKLGENELRASETRFRTFVDHATDAFFLQDEQGSILDVNRQACESLGYTREELIGMPPREFNPESNVAFHELVKAQLEAGEICTFETSHRRKNGTIFPVEVRVRLFLHDGHRFALALARDITERRRAEEELRESESRYRNIFQTAGVSIWEEDFSRVKIAIDELKAQGVRDFRQYLGTHPEFVRQAIPMVRVVDVNDSTLKLFGADSKDELLGSLHRVFLPETEEVFAGELIALAEGRTTYEAETVLQTMKGENLVVLFTLTFPSQPSRLDSVLVSVMDITERRRAEEALQEAQVELAHVTRVTTMGELTSSIAHEVNQPLTAIVTNGNACLRWLATEPPNLGEARESVGSIIKEGHRAGEVISRIRSLVKKSTPEKAKVDINSLIQDVIALVHGEMLRNRVLLRTELAPDLPPVRGDRVQLQQVLLNLSINGMEAMSGVMDRPRKLLITSQKHGHDGVLVAIQDSGVGIEAQNVAQLFNAFFTTKPDGLGMGLSISRNTIEAHGGRLWATVNDGWGATFQFTLPTNHEGV